MKNAPQAPVSVLMPISADATVDQSQQQTARGVLQLPTSFLVVYSAFLVIALAKIHLLLPATATLPWAKAFGAILLVMAAKWLPLPLLRRALKTTAGKAVLFMSIWGLLSIPGSVWPGFSLQFVQSDYWKTLLIFVVTGVALLDIRAGEWAIAALGIGAGLNAVKILVFGAGLMDNRTFASLAFDPNESAALFVVGIPMMLHIAASRRGFWRFTAGATVLLLAVTIVKTGSRGGFVGLAALLIWLIARAPRRLRARYILGVVGCLVAFGVAADKTTWERLSSIFATDEDYNYTAREGRMEVWKRGVGYMLTHPVLGVGINAFSIAEGTIGGKETEGRGIKNSAAHNSFLEVGAELGLPGLVAFLIAWVASLKAFVRMMRLGARGIAPPADGALGSCMAAAIVGWGVSSFFLSLAYHPITLFIFGAGAASAVLSSLHAARHRQAVREQRDRAGLTLARSALFGA